ncbi:MAG: hypothetical protein EBR59_09165, partial [Methylococcaceae bacterium]|nr:hypothetical protein [Methylococcaceae bacterium]
VHQYQVFGGFSTYSLASAASSTPTALQTSVLADGAVKFLATGSSNGAISSTTADDAYRVSVKYDSVQTLSLRGGSDASNGSSGFALDFGPGVNWSGATTARNTPAKNLVYSQSGLNETARNDGSISGSVVINLVNDTFTGINGDDLVSSGKAVLSGLPAGISASILRNSANSVLLSFTGQALSHQAIDSSTVFIRFADSAFTSGQAATVTGNGDHAIALNFQNQPVLLYSNNTFYEAAGNNGAIANSLVISLSGDTFSSSVVSANKIDTIGLPPGLSANFVRVDDTHLLATLSGTATNHGVSNNLNALTFRFLDGAFTNTASAAQVSNAVNNQLKIDFANPGAVIAFSDTSFTEAANNNGSITQTLTLNLSGDSFTGNTGDNLLAGKAVVNNLPSGLTASLQRTSASTAVLSLTGNAVAHAAVNSVGNLGISFSDTAFTGGNAANIARATNTNMLAIQFTDPPALSYSSSTFLESADNDGTIANTLTVTLQNDTFSSNVLSKITPVNVPAGLTASFTRVDDTHLTISLAGTASAHTNLNDISNLGFTFQNGAFTNTAVASGVKNYAKNDLGVDFTNYVLITAPVLSYSAGGFVESVANDGSIANHLIITLTKDTFASDVISAGKVLLSNLPAGLQANFVRLDDNHLDLSLSGSATQHANANDRGDLSLTFLDGAFTSTARAANVTNYVKNDLSLDFNDPPSLAYSANSFTESPLNNGSLANTLTITLSNDQFAADVVSGNKIQVSNLPAGLTPVFTFVDSTHIRVSLSGTVSPHANLNDVNNLTFSFLSGAFVNTASAANVVNATKNDL